MIYPNDVMNEVLRDEIGCALFKAYLKTIYCSETLQFWQEIETFKPSAPPTQLKDKETSGSMAFSTTDSSSSSSSNNIMASTSDVSSTITSNSTTSTTTTISKSNNKNNKKDNNNSNNNGERKYLSQDELRTRAQSIFDRYLENGSEFELNIDAISREVVRARLAEEIDSSIFDDVQKTVYESLWMDCFPPFTHTAAYHKYKRRLPSSKKRLCF